MGERTTFGRQRHRESGLHDRQEPVHRIRADHGKTARASEVSGQTVSFSFCFDFCESRADSIATLHVHVKMHVTNETLWHQPFILRGLHRAMHPLLTLLRALCAEGGLPSLTSMPHHVTFWLAVSIPVHCPFQRLHGPEGLLLSAILSTV